jgi:hypothetical protein
MGTLRIPDATTWMQLRCVGYPSLGSKSRWTALKNCLYDAFLNALGAHVAFIRLLKYLANRSSWANA